MTAIAIDPILCLEGEMTIYTAAETKQRLMTSLAAASRLDVDLSAVTELDSAGLQLLVLAWREASRLGKALRYVNASPAVQELLEFCNLTGRFEAVAGA